MKNHVSSFYFQTMKPPYPLPPIILPLATMKFVIVLLLSSFVDLSSSREGDAAAAAAAAADGKVTYVSPRFACSPSKLLCASPGHECLANLNHPQATTDVKCSPCMSADREYWPCDVDGLCYCRDASRPRIPPAGQTELVVFHSGISFY